MKRIWAALLGCMAFAEVPAGATDLLPSAGPPISEASTRQLFSPTPIASDPKWAVTFLAGASAGDDNLR